MKHLSTLLIIVLFAQPMMSQTKPNDEKLHSRETLRMALSHIEMQNRLLDLNKSRMESKQVASLFWTRISPELRIGIVATGVILFLGVITWFVGKNLIDHKADREGK